ncbi:hypothetical protein AM500_13730 [Bacillus sp. FJAT-18017]|uniref:DUF2268 domain-containing putative Zn-dependent protease n=1 Tax=Bacillus sp. FJAT-18017 TaxID=1705566 RepID=UPI0006AE3478|nr:DUF2268 domain-containing putative Zn-dependent protease [Bacillus sp. FJAT-18017]ALC90728.1 hypothetical protein AM500_13730 [Bacillus sp. FJAT-18017]
MLEIKQITPIELVSNRNNLEEFLRQEFAGRVSERTWMTEWEQLAQRFQMFQFLEMTESELKSMEWNTADIEQVVRETFQIVSRYLPLDEMRIMVVPALPFSYFEKQPLSLWSNAFTNGPGNIIVAIPPQPDIDFLQYLLAHEMHHACPENPIYNISLSSFTLEQWFKMEGTAEFFSLSLFKDKRWWKDNLPKEREILYWNECKDHLQSTNDMIKSPLCFGSRKRGIPVFAGYLFALSLVSNYVSTNPTKDIRELYKLEPAKLIECYKGSVER